MKRVIVICQQGASVSMYLNMSRFNSCFHKLCMCYIAQNITVQQLAKMLK